MQNSQGAEIMNSETDTLVIEEVESIRAILMHEMEAKYNEHGRPVEVVITMHPSTAEDTEMQLVCVTLVIYLPPNYPEVSPSVHLKNPRGLGEDMLRKIYQDCKTKCDNYCGMVVMYDLIEIVRDALTNWNKPSGPCPICLCAFANADSVSKTECYHHFHSYCLGTYIRNYLDDHKKKQAELPAWQQELDIKVVCPVCREIITYDLGSLLAAPVPVEEASSDIVLSDELRQLQKRMSALYLQQKAKGGIIDIEAEENRFLLPTGQSGRPENGNSDYETQIYSASASSTSGHAIQITEPAALQGRCYVNRANEPGNYPQTSSSQATNAYIAESGKQDRSVRSGKPRHGRREWSYRRKTQPSSSSQSNGCSTEVSDQPKTDSSIRERKPASSAPRARRPPPGFHVSGPVPPSPPSFGSS